MGNTCKGDQNITLGLIDKLSNTYPEKSANHQYYICELPHGPYIQNKKKYSDIIENCTMMKDKTLDRYFIGKLDKNGNPQGKGILYDPQNLFYCGQFKAGRPHGRGKLEFIKEELVYQGQLKQGRAEGQGKVTSFDQQLQFVGIMENSLPKTGKLRLSNQSQPIKQCEIQLNDFPNHPSKIKYGNGRIYQGYLNKRTFAPQGKGTAYFTDNSHYQGEWKDGQMNGRGSFYWQDGSSYHGEYQDGKKHGLGTFNFMSKTNKYYDGQWANGKQHGNGSLIDGSGKILKKGHWINGSFQKYTSSI